MSEYLILVDENDHKVGIGEKLKTHENGVLHRCFSIFIFNKNNEILLQQRAVKKYHSGGLLTNACCGHPRPGESTDDAAHRRLKEEMGFDCAIMESFTFIYRAELDNGYTEHEFDHVFIGTYNGDVDPNPDEVDNYIWRTVESVQNEISQNPGNFTVWFIIAFNEMLARNVSSISEKL